MKKIIFALAFLIAPVALAHATPFETSIATFTGDFANGGDLESDERLIGNSSSTGYGFGILQQNRVRIYIASGTRNGGYSLVDSTPSTAGYVGVWTDGITQIPQYTLDVWGQFRSTGSAYLATSTGSVGIGIATPTYKLHVSGDIKANNFTGSSFVGNGSLLTGITSASISSATYISSGSGNVNNFHIADNSITTEKILDRGISDSDLPFTVNITSLTVYSGITSTSGFKAGGSTISAGGFSGSGASLINLDATKLVGNIPVNNLNGGTNASGTTFWRGDGTWDIPAGGGGGGGSATTFSSGSFNVIISSFSTDGVQIELNQNNYVQGTKVIMSTVAYLNKAGAGGMCNGQTEAASTWYGVWAFANASTMSVCFSSSGVFPSLTGYNDYMQLGYIRNDASSNIVPALQRDKNYLYYTSQQILNAANPSTGIGTLLYLTDVVPPGTVSVDITIQGSGSATHGVVLTPYNHTQILTGGGGEPIVYGYYGESQYGRLTQRMNIGGKRNDIRAFYYGDDGNCSSLSLAIPGFSTEGF